MQIARDPFSRRKQPIVVHGGEVEFQVLTHPPPGPLRSAFDEAAPIRIPDISKTQVFLIVDAQLECSHFQPFSVGGSESLREGMQKIAYYGEGRGPLATIRSRWAIAA